MVSIFGESDVDKRDYMMGSAGLLAGIHSLRILAENGVASTQDIRIAKEGIEGILDRIPRGQVDPKSLQKLKDMLLKILLAAAQAEADSKKA